MTKELFIVLSLFLFATCLQESGTNLLLNQLSECNDPDCMPIQKGAKNHYVEVSILSKDSQLPFFRSNKSQTSEFLKSMMLSLSTSETFLSSKCESFLPYDCTQFYCEECSDSNRTTSNTYFNAVGCEMRVYFYLKDFWHANAKSFRAQACHDGKVLSIGEGTHGIIALGVEGSGKNNFRDPHPVFTLYLNKNGIGGELWARKNLYKVDSIIPEVSLNSTGSWHIYGVENIQIENFVLDYNFTDTELILDLDATTLGFSSYIYWKLLEALQHGEIPIKCWRRGFSNLYKPNCSYYGKLEDLPNITIPIQGQKLLIPLSIYVDSPESYDPTRGWIVLNINGHNATANIPETFVTEKYEHSIILDSNFMKYYGLVFDGSNLRIEIYRIRQVPPDPDSNDSRIFILRILKGVLIVVFLLIIGMLVLYKKYYRAKNQKIPSKNSIEKPLIHDDAFQKGQENSDFQAVNHPIQKSDPPKQDRKYQKSFDPSFHANQTDNEFMRCSQHPQSHQINSGEHLLQEGENEANISKRKEPVTLSYFNRQNLQSENYQGLNDYSQNISERMNIN